jgi:hypothetical protein
MFVLCYVLCYSLTRPILQLFLWYLVKNVTIIPTYVPSLFSVPFLSDTPTPLQTCVFSNT